MKRGRNEYERPTTAQLADLHVFIVPPELWRGHLQSAANQIIDESISGGFIRVLPETTLVDLREELEREIGLDILPQEYVFLKSVGRCVTRVKPKQELQMKVKHFLPPQAYAPELFLMEVTEDMKNLPFSGTTSQNSTARVRGNYGTPRSDRNGFSGQRPVPPIGTGSSIAVQTNEEPPAPPLSATPPASPQYYSDDPSASNRQQADDERENGKTGYLPPFSATPPPSPVGRRSLYHSPRRARNSREATNPRRGQLSGDESDSSDNGRKGAITYRADREDWDRYEDTQQEEEEEERRRRAREDDNKRRQEEERRRQDEERRKQDEDRRRQREEEMRRKRQEEERRNAEKEEQLGRQIEERRNAEKEEQLRREQEEERKRKEQVQRQIEEEKKREAEQDIIHDKESLSKSREGSQDHSGEIENLRKTLQRAKQQRQEMERQREELVKKAKQLQNRTQQKRNQARDIWKRKYFEEKKRTQPLEEQCAKLRQELDSLHRRVMSQLEGTKDHGAGKTQGNAKPSQQNNLKIQATRLQHDIEDLQRRVENIKMKLTTEMKLRNQAEGELKVLRAELTQKKIGVTLSRNQQGFTTDRDQEDFIPP